MWKRIFIYLSTLSVGLIEGNKYENVFNKGAVEKDNRYHRLQPL